MKKLSIYLLSLLFLSNSNSMTLNQLSTKDFNEEVELDDSMNPDKAMDDANIAIYSKSVLGEGKGIQ